MLFKIIWRTVSSVSPLAEYVIVRQFTQSGPIVPIVGIVGFCVAQPDSSSKANGASSHHIRRLFNFRIDFLLLAQLGPERASLFPLQCGRRLASLPPGR